MLVLGVCSRSQCGCVQVIEQMEAQSARASSIVIALTDGKLGIYPHELAVQQVSV